MVAHQQQAVAVAGMQQDGTENGAVLQVYQLTLVGGGPGYGMSRIGFLGKCHLTQCEQVAVTDGTYYDGAVTDDGTQHVMMNGKSLQGLLQDSHADGLQDTEYDGLCEPARLRQVPAEETVLESSWCNGSGQGLLWNGLACAADQDAGHVAYGTALHQVADLCRETFFVQLARKLNHLDGIAAKDEETVEHADGLFPVEYISYQAGNGLFFKALGGNIVCMCGIIGLRKFLAVHLAVGRQRKGVQLFINSGYHVVGQRLVHETAQLISINGLFRFLCRIVEAERVAA